MSLLRTADHECRMCYASVEDMNGDDFCNANWPHRKFPVPTTGIRSDCPLTIGHAENDCPLTTAYMTGYEKGKDFAKALQKSAETSQAVEEDGDE